MKILHRILSRMPFAVCWILLLSLFFPSPVFASSCNSPVVNVPGGPGRPPMAIGGFATFSCLEDIFTNVLHYAIAGAAIASFIMILMGGFSWLTSGGDPKHLEQARDKITYGIAGLVIMILVWFILKFLSTFTGVIDINYFAIPK